MKIVHVLLGKANPNTMNGVNKVVHHLATEQHRAGHDVEVWGLTDTPNERPPEPEFVLRLFPVSRPRLVLAPELRANLAALPVQSWVQLHSVFIPEFRIIAGLLRRRGIRFGVTPHGGYSVYSLARGRWKKAAYLSLAEKGLLRRAHLLQAIGASEVDDIRRLDPRASIVRVPNGQAPIDLAPAAAAPTDNPRPIVCYCGRFDIGHKGLDILLHGFAGYTGEGGTGTLWLIGDRGQRPLLEAMVEDLGIGHRVRFHGAQFGASKLQRFAAADAFIHTSRWDVTPTAALEAAAAGLPLVISEETNLADEVRAHGAGMVLSHNTPAGVAAALAELQATFEQGALSAMGAAARRMIEQDFSWPRLSERLVAAYGSASAAAPARPGG